MSDDIWFHGWEPILRVVLVGVISYAILILFLRASGKRALSRMSVYDFVISMALGSILAKILLSPDNALAESVTAMALLISLQYGMSWAETRSKFIRRLISSKPTLLYHEGHFLESAMRRERIAKEDVENAVHERGACGMEQVEAVILGSNGQFAVLVKQRSNAARSSDPTQ